MVTLPRLKVPTFSLQTGSGKTFTITGGPERYTDRGIIPRSLSYVFEHFQQVRAHTYIHTHTRARAQARTHVDLFENGPITRTHVHTHAHGLHLLFLGGADAGIALCLFGTGLTHNLTCDSSEFCVSLLNQTCLVHFIGFAHGGCKMSFLFSVSQNPESEFTTHVSYLEIYNENGYDLLDPKHDAAKLEDLP